MICSISRGKCGSNWLDRLRSNKGFPVGDDLDLDHFLEKQDNNPESNSSESTQSPKVATGICGENENGGDKGGWLGIMNNVLSDLFIMGGESNQSCKFSRKKSSRKQMSPKFCSVSSMTTSHLEEEQSSGGCARKDENAQMENDLKEEVEGEDNVNNVEREEGEREKLLGYSRNEVTVIDTSCMEWKFEKLVYRKRNEWKVRDKKSKSRIIGLGRKKRKENGVGVDADVVAKKKFKLSNQEDCIFSSKHSSLVEEGEQFREETSKYPNQDPKKMFLSRLIRKAKKGVKSAILKKGKSSSKKAIEKCPKSPSPNGGIEKPQACSRASPFTFPMGEGFRD